MNFLPHLIVLLAGGVMLFLIKRKYTKISNGELIVIFILLTILVAIFTDKGIDLAKRVIDLIQVD